MNGLEIIVLLIIALCAFLGYRAGLIRVVYSLFAWLLVLGFVTWSTPYITTYIEKNTSMKDAIKEKCLDYMEQSMAESIENVPKGQAESHQEILENAGIKLPEILLDKITDSAADTANEILVSTGMYEQIAESIAHLIIEGIAFFIAFTVAGIAVKYLAHVLDLISYLPVIHGMNKTLGVAAGLLKGLAIIWLVFYIIALCCTSEIGAQLLFYIQESPILFYLYNNNILLQIIMIFL